MMPEPCFSYVATLTQPYPTILKVALISPPTPHKRRSEIFFMWNNLSESISNANIQHLYILAIYLWESPSFRMVVCWCWCWCWCCFHIKAYIYIGSRERWMFLSLQHGFAGERRSLIFVQQPTCKTIEFTYLKSKLLQPNCATWFCNITCTKHIIPYASAKGILQRSNGKLYANVWVV